MAGLWDDPWIIRIPDPTNGQAVWLTWTSWVGISFYFQVQTLFFSRFAPRESFNSCFSPYPLRFLFCPSIFFLQDLLLENLSKNISIPTPHGKDDLFDTHRHLRHTNQPTIRSTRWAPNCKIEFYHPYKRRKINGLCWGYFTSINGVSYTLYSKWTGFSCCYFTPTYMVPRTKSHCCCSLFTGRPTRFATFATTSTTSTGGSVSQVLHREGPMPESLIACYAMQLLEVPKIFQRGEKRGVGWPPLRETGGG